jgi:mannose-6-phosphate isomerase-like protein (cupin superfamily)
MPLKKIVLDELSSRLSQPFMPITLATVNDMAVNAILSQGQFPWHQHEHLDEIFYVHQGHMLLETQIGNTLLHAGELALAPANVPHSPSSEFPALVLFMLKYQQFPRNGYHNQLPGYERLPDKINLAQRAKHLRAFEPDELTVFDDFVLRLLVCDGAQNWHTHPSDDECVLVYDGQARLEMSDEAVPLATGELVVTPKDLPHRLVSSQRTTLMLVSRVTLRAG